MTHNGATDRPADGTRSRRTRGLLATPTTLRTFAAIYVALAMNGSFVLWFTIPLCKSSV